MSYTDIVQTVAIVITLVAFIVTQYANRKSTHANSFVRINEEYNRLVTYRLECPEVLEIAKNWGDVHLDQVAGSPNLTRYYNYGELCIGFCDTCLYHKNKKLITKDDLDNYYSGLMDLVATENRAFFENIANGKYCSLEFKKWFSAWKKNH